MNADKKNLIKNLIEFGKEAYKRELIWGNSGNISHRLDENSIVISSSGAHLGKLNPEEFIIFNLDSEKWEGTKKPSMETKIHTMILKKRKDVNCVFHSQPFFSTLIACSNLEIDPRLLPESMAYLDKVRRVPYHHPGSRELVQAISETIEGCNALVLTNHGVICTAKSLEGALLRTETLEMLCRMIASAKIGNIRLNFLPQFTKDDFLKHLSKMDKTP